MALYLTKLVNGQVQKLRVSPTKALYRGYWAVIVGGFAGTSVTCNGVTKFIGSSERVAFNITTPGTYTFTATRQGTTLTKEVVLNDDTPEYIINLSMFIDMQYLEYIEADGTQYIDTGVVPHKGYSADLTFQFRDLTTPSGISPNTQICGVQQNGDSNRFYPIAVRGDGTQIGSCYGNTQVIYSVDSLSKHTVNLNKNSHIYLDGTDYGSCANSYVEPSDSQYTMYLFKWNYGESGPSNPVCKMRIYGYKMYDNNGILVRDMIPVKDDTGRGALYDYVTQQMYYNAGTGDFICGPNKLYTRIQYIESTGTQYIDTGFYPNQDTGVKIKAKFNSVSNSSALLFGSGLSAREKTFEFYLWDTRPSFNYDNYNYEDNIRIQIGDMIIIDWDKNIIDYSINDVSKPTITRPYREFNAPYTMGLFAVKRPKGVYIGKVSIYLFQIWQDDILVRDFIPVLDGNGVPCMYDKVEGKFYYNAGTGDFIAGPEE